MDRIEMDIPESNDPDVQRFGERLKKFHALTADQRLELAVAILSRKPLERRDSALELFRAAFPHAAEEMYISGAFHAYSELPDAARDLLAWLELCLRETRHEQHHGIMFDILYHLYNWQQVESLIPYGREDVFVDLKSVKKCLEGGDKEGALKTLEELMERFRAGTSPPQIEG